MIDGKESDERYQIGENKEEIFNTDIEVLQQKYLVPRYIYNVEIEYDERNFIDISNDNNSYERDQIRGMMKIYLLVI